MTRYPELIDPEYMEKIEERINRLPLSPRAIVEAAAETSDQCLLGRDLIFRLFHGGEFAENLSMAAAEYLIDSGLRSILQTEILSFVAANLDGLKEHVEQRRPKLSDELTALIDEQSVESHFATFAARRIRL